MYSKTNATSKTVNRSVMGLGILQYDMGNHIADVTTAVNDLIQQLIKILHSDHLERLTAAAEEFLVECHHMFVRFPFQELKLLIQILDFVEIHSITERPNHFENNVRGPVQEADLSREINAMGELRRYENPFRKLFNRFGYFVQGGRKSFNVLPFKRGDESAVDCGADLFGDLFIFAARMPQIVQHFRLIQCLAELDQRLHAGVGFSRAGFQQREKFVFLAQNSLK